MVKKIIVGIAVAAFIAAVGLGYYTLKSKSRPRQIDVFKAVPRDALFIMRVNDSEQVMRALSCLEAGESEDVFMLLNQHWLSKDSTLNAKIPSYLVVSSHPADSIGRSGMIYYIVFPKEDAREKFYQRMISGKSPAYVRSHTANSGELVFDNGTLLHFRQLRHIVMLSTSDRLAVAAAAQWDKEESLVTNPQFTSALHTSGRNATLNLFINSDLLSDVSSSPFENKAGGGLLDIFSFSSSTGWMSLDVNVRGKLSNLTGFWSGSGLAAVGNPLFKIPESQAGYFRYLPYGSAYVQGATFSNLDSVFSYYESYLESRNKHMPYLQTLAAMSDSLGVNIRTFISEMLPQELAIAYIPTTKNTGEWLTVMKVASVDIALANLRTLVREGDLNPVKGAIGNLFGGVFRQNNEAYFAYVDSYIMFSSSRRILEEAKAKKNNFKQALDDLKVDRYLLSNASTFAYRNLQNFGNKILTIGKFNMQSRLTFQLGLVNNVLYCNIVTPVRPNPDWSTTIVDEEPELTNTNKKEKESEQKLNLFRKTAAEGKKRFLLEQDKDFSLTITQLDGGTIIVPADGVIRNAEICDMTGKGAYRWVFNTDSLIYMITAEGVASKGFPITLPASATNGISVFDYGNTRDYRIFVACADRKVYLYDKYGKPVEGWKAKQTESVVIEPINFFRIENKDYIVFADEENVYILHRRGDDRVVPKEKIVKTKGSEFKGLVNPPRITCEDTEGRIVVIHLSDGKVERK
ncbi:MAG: hypothetical protein LBG19_01750 [Prevotellaceae bacterium]|jgi:hypothetical protein|nr:hypothetical protein [Prevotellaceae bacterium]